MKKTKGEPKGAQLSAIEMAHLDAFQAKAEAAQAKTQLKRLEAIATRATLESQILKLQESHRQADARLRSEIDDLEAVANRLIGEHDKFTRGLASKYDVSWAECAYNELTGALTPVP